MSAGGRLEWEVELFSPDAETTRHIASRMGQQLQAGDLMILTGELGAGKTTFTQGLGEGLGVRGGIISPTFVLVRIHPNLAAGPRPGGPQLVHVDAYRLEGPAEIDDIDLEATTDSSVTVVEWGSGRVEHLSESRLEVHLLRATGGESANGWNTNGWNTNEWNTGGGDAGGRNIVVRNFDPEVDDEPRLIRVAAFGPRWAGTRLL